MAMPTDVKIIDLMLGIPSADAKPSYDFMRPLLRDEESLKSRMVGKDPRYTKALDQFPDDVSSLDNDREDLYA